MIKRDDNFNVGVEEPNEIHESRMQQLVTKCLASCKDPRYMWSVLGVILIFMALWWLLGSFGFVSSGDFPVTFRTKWQAVFLANNQVYFGHVQNYNRKYLRLKDVYYLQVAQPLQQGQESAPNLNLVKLGRELHGPEDSMFIPKDKVLFWENMKPDSQVVKSIESTRR